MVLGVDIGGSHITAAEIDMEAQAILPATIVRQSIHSGGEAAAIIKDWAAALSPLIATVSSADVKIGIAMPGPFDYEKGISYIQGQDKYGSLFELPVKSMLAAELQLQESAICFANDASCFILGEVFGGAAKGARKAMGFTLGTGLGSARFLNGKSEDASLWCMPFKASIAENYLSTRACLHQYQALTGKTLRGVKELAQLYPTDQQAREVFQHLSENLADFLEQALRADLPDVVVIGGNIANAWDLFVPGTEKILAAKGIKIPLKKTLLAESAALVGAASLWS
ncbi:ROK family protein [Pontibacter qinzhouensis]|uniref:ROK family protein n=1 Tax=Pontibacter qinzhouensis TaxID=2603253 RepID=A0A5C8J8Q2_9BACT|nr:ROK family protein [Pontibacter qinzhouensis]TXK33297.1 ROK family protein [Pontibacter qinzhouensis]